MPKITILSTRGGVNVSRIAKAQSSAQKPVFVADTVKDPATLARTLNELTQHIRDRDTADNPINSGVFVQVKRSRHAPPRSSRMGSVAR